MEKLGEYFFPSSLPTSNSGTNLHQKGKDKNKDKDKRKNRIQKKDARAVARRGYGYSSRFVLPYRTLSHRPLQSRRGSTGGMGGRGMSVAMMQVMMMMMMMY